VDEDAWERSGLALLSVDENKTLVLFSSDTEMSDFRRRLGEYQQGPPPQQKGAPHQQMFASIDQIGDVRPEDRIGRLLRAEGVESPAAIEDANEYVVDVELWDLGGRDANRAKVAEVRRYVEQQAGRVSDDYVGESLVLLRSRCTGKVVKDLLEVDYVAMVDLPPRPTLSVSELLDVGIEDLREIPAPQDGAPGVAVLDSGLTAAHPLIGPAVGEATTVPRALGDASDGHGHGTMVAGLALYGDVEQCIASRSFVPRLTLYSARVLNDDLGFDDESLITTQMREAIQYFRETYGCRVFNASLGDDRLPYLGGKVSPWASVLDTLARDLNVVIVVSAGNHEYDPGDGNSPDGHVQDYPRYLLDDAAKIIEPATGSIVLTVGALAHTTNVPPGAAGNSVAFRPIAQELQPSPFTRSGPGLGGAVKPDLCEIGGNCAYDGLTRRLRDVRELSVVSMNRQYVERLFTTDTGTSFAAPKVAHAAARLYESFPDATANLIRALLAASASVPEPSEQVLQPQENGAVLRVCGYGRPDLGPQFQEALRSRTIHGSTVDRIPLIDMPEFPILVPESLDEQRAIAHILGTLDDKIELNRRMSETLEAMARALFKSWFVDFDPVRAKAEGRDPGLPDAIAALFPDALIEHPDLGEIPEGWEAGTLSALANLNSESWSRSTAPELVRYVDLANTKWGSITSIVEYPWEAAPSRARRVLRPWDTIVGTVRPGNGSYVLIMEQGLTGSTGFAVLRPRESRYRSLVYCAATSRDNIDRLSHLADGAAYPAVRPDVVAATRVVIASDPILDAFAHVVDPLLVKVAAAERESRTLAALRDALLPKLISGELRLEDSARILGRAG